MYYPAAIDAASMEFARIRGLQVLEHARLVSYYLERGIPHTVIDGLSEDELAFYAGSMRFWQEARKQM